MPKQMKISFEIIESAQVDAHYFSAETQETIKDMISSGAYEEDEIVESIREYRDGDGVCVSNGMFVDDENITCTISDGDETLSVNLISYFDGEYESFEEMIADHDLQESKAIIAVDVDNQIYLTKSDDPSKKQSVMLEIINYMSGQLVGWFEVEDDVNLQDLDMKDFKIQLLSVDGEGELQELTYGEGLIGSLCELEIHKVSYKGKDLDLGLNFQGGSGEARIYMREEDGTLSWNPYLFL
ncbi:hypothetical protein [Marinobacter sp. S6332]|uniref:hypothetical protein n=1 Tax=Marinobacter sp. S6332 TaxID=2926403 RepID=UPI001FF6D8F9|nr:hypothetical protein [Marinobacter sp. S6332]MCK0165634.1 hypothetical protein [Marinobacter sp. S6332]